MSKQMNIAILGCGPSGLLAAHAVERTGHRPVIISRKTPSMIHGAQYLHSWIPHLTSITPDFGIRYGAIGDSEGYARKVYGDPTTPVSFDRYAGGGGAISEPAWSMEKMYRKLWDRYESRIISMSVGWVTIDQLVNANDPHGMIISSIPRPATCKNLGHHFGKKPIWITDMAAREVEGDNRIVYNGDPHDPWYRSSRINGIESTEFAQPTPDAWQGFKVLDTDCDCWADEVFYIGRFGLWRRGVLVDSAASMAFTEVVRRFGIYEPGLRSTVIS